MIANRIASLLRAALAAAVEGIRSDRGKPAEGDLRERIVDAIAGRSSGALVLFEGSGLDMSVLSGGLFDPGDEVIEGDGRFAIHLSAPGRDAEFARWLCRAQVLLENRGGTVRIGATRTSPDAWPEDQLIRAERALERAKTDGTAVVIDDLAPPRALAAEAAAIASVATPILCAERHHLVAVEPLAPPEAELRALASLEAARHLFLAQLRSGARMLARHGDPSMGLSLRLPDDLASDPNLHLALVFGLDGCDIPPERVTLRIGADVSVATAAALMGIGCTVSTAAATPEAVGAGPHWLPAALIRDMDADETVRGLVAGILARAVETGAKVHASGIASPETAHTLATLGCALISGPGIAPAFSDHALASATGAGRVLGS